MTSDTADENTLIKCTHAHRRERRSNRGNLDVKETDEVGASGAVLDEANDGCVLDAPLVGRVRHGHVQLNHCSRQRLAK